MPSKIAVVPLLPSVADTSVSVSPSGSVSLARTSISTGVPTIAFVVSSVAVGPSLIGFTVTLTVEVSVPPRPSVTVTVKLSVPEKSGSGV